MGKTARQKALALIAATLMIILPSGLAVNYAFEQVGAKHHQALDELEAEIQQEAQQAARDRAAAEKESAEVIPPISFAEQMKLTVQRNTPGLLATEHVGLSDADVLTYDVLAAVCSMNSDSVLSLDELKHRLTDSIRRQQGLDEKKSENLAKGLIETVLQPGVCDDILGM